MTQRFGLPAALFSLKAYAAAMLALYAAFSIGLERPYWAFLTAYIVAQPLAGAVISKAIFRVMGTFVGAAAAIAMVSALYNSPELLTLAIGLWLGLCVFVSLLERTPRAYMFVLAGYSACLIVLPTVEEPGTIFTVASLRVQEIMLGILSGSLVHGVVFPGSVTEFMLRRVATIVADAEHWSSRSLAVPADPDVEKERQRLALDITELHQLSIHLPFDTSRLVPRVRVVRALQDRLSMLLPLSAAVADRLAVLGEARGGVPKPMLRLLADTREALEVPAPSIAERHERADALIARAAALEPAIAPDSGWRDLVLLSLSARLATLIAAHRDVRDLSDQLATPDRRPVSPRIPKFLEERRDRELHRDPAGALRGAAGAFLTIVIGSALWIGSGWRDGSTAVMLAGVFLALFAASDNPLLPLKAFLTGTIVATLLGAFYGYVIMPRLDSFPLLAAAMAPPLLVLGALMYSPRYSGIALPTLLGLGSPALLAVHYVSAFEPFVNGSIAQLVGIAFAILMARLLQSAGVERAIRRTVRAGWRDIAARSNLMAPPDVRAWINRMLDRVALLAPRLSMAGRPPGMPIYDALRDLRTGVAIGELRRLRLDIPPQEAPPLTRVLAGVGAYYDRLDPAAPKPAEPALLGDIDNALDVFAGDGDSGVRRAAALGLVSLRRSLFPAASGYREAAA
jgi:uncharacterized membrane protein YccC